MANMVKSIEYIEIVVGTTDLIVNSNLTKGQIPANCVPFMTLHSGGYYWDAKLFDIYFTGSFPNGVINFERTVHRSYSARIKCYVVEFDTDEVKVQQGTFNVDTVATHEVTLASGVSNVNKAAMTFGWKASSTLQSAANSMVRGRVTSTTTLDFYRNLTTSNANGHWFLFEDLNDNINVSHVTSSFSSGSSTINIDGGRCVDPLRTFVLGSYATNCTSTYGTRNTGRTYLHSDGTMRRDRQETGSYSHYWNAQVVEFLDQTKIYVPFDYSPYWGFSATSATRTFGSNSNYSMFNCNPSTSIVATGQMQGIARANSTSTSTIQESQIGVSLTAGGTLTYSKYSASYSIYPSYTVAVDWAGISVDIGTNSEPITEGTAAGQSFVKSVENFRLIAEDNFNAQALSKGQDWENCAVFASNRSAGARYYYREHMSDVYLVSPGVLCCRRGESTADKLYVDVSVVEFWPEQVKVQQKRVYTMKNTTVNVLIEPVSDVNKCFVLSKGMTTGSVQSANSSFIRNRLVTASGVELYTQNTANYLVTAFFVVEDLQNNFNTAHYTGSFGDGSDQAYAGDDGNDGSVCNHTNNSFTISSYATDCSSTYGTRNFVRAYFSNEFRPVYLDRYEVGSYTIYWSATVVSFVDKAFHVQYFNKTIGTASTSTYTYRDEFASNKQALTACNCGQQSVCKISSTSSSTIADAFLTARITDYDTNELEISKGNSSYSANVSVIMIDWIGTDLLATPKNTPIRSAINSIQIDKFNTTSGFFELNLTKGQNIEQCVPFASNSLTASDHYINRGYKVIIRNDSIGNFGMRFGSGSTSNRKIASYIVEFSEGVKIQSGSGYSTGTTKTFTIDEVDLDRAFLVCYAYSDTWERWLSSIAVCGHFNSSTELEFIRALSSGGMYISWYVVECSAEDNYWKVDHKYETSKGSASSVYVTPNHNITPSKTLFFSSWAVTATNDYPTRNLYKMKHKANNSIVFSRYDTGSYEMSNVNVEIVEFNAEMSSKGFKTVYKEVNLNGGTVTTDIDLRLDADEYFDLDRSMVISGNMNSTGMVNTTSETGLDEGFHYYEFKDGTTVTAEKKGGTSYTTSSFFYATQFPKVNKYYMEGTVEEVSSPVVRTIHAYRSLTGELVDVTTSESGTGYFFVESPYYDEHHLVCFDEAGGNEYNELIYGQLEPAVISGTTSYMDGTVASGIPVGMPLGRL